MRQTFANSKLVSGPACQANAFGIFRDVVHAHMHLHVSNGEHASLDTRYDSIHGSIEAIFGVSLNHHMFRCRQHLASSTFAADMCQTLSD